MFANFPAGYEPSQARTAGITNPSSQPHGTDLIGQPILFAHGQFSGFTIRAELREVQQAQLGRKYARVDRRPLDPPPVIVLNLYKVYNAGTDQELEKELRDYELVQLLGLICTVDLFPIPSPPKQTSKGELRRKARTMVPTHQLMFTSSIPNFAASSSHGPINHSQQSSGFPQSSRYSSSPSISDSMMVSPTQSTSSSLSGYGHHMTMPPDTPDIDPDIVHYVGQHPIKESSKMTSALVGATFVQPALIDYLGKKSIMFVFADLAVKTEGSFILRYRFFDLFSQPYNCGNLVVQAECYGGAFRVYSTKEFPGLQASTELTKQLARWGVRLNTRETERRRRKKGEARSSSRETNTAQKRKRPLSEDADGVSGSDDDD
ncbi:hypothetical protein H0H87_002126 [Tephrocybe sp. NHM501043]|nr:hypothetical protein H0H87_002126 [Tephrocybe sp. NHM501043]